MKERHGMQTIFTSKESVGLEQWVDPPLEAVTLTVLEI